MRNFVGDGFFGSGEVGLEGCGESERIGEGGEFGEDGGFFGGAVDAFFGIEVELEELIAGGGVVVFGIDIFVEEVRFPRATSDAGDLPFIIEEPKAEGGVEVAGTGGGGGEGIGPSGSVDRSVGSERSIDEGGESGKKIGKPKEREIDLAGRESVGQAGDEGGAHSPFPGRSFFIAEKAIGAALRGAGGSAVAEEDHEGLGGEVFGVEGREDFLGGGVESLEAVPMGAGEGIASGRKGRRLEDQSERLGGLVDEGGGALGQGVEEVGGIGVWVQDVLIFDKGWIFEVMKGETVEKLKSLVVGMAAAGIAEEPFANEGGGVSLAAKHFSEGPFFGLPTG